MRKFILFFFTFSTFYAFAQDDNETTEEPLSEYEIEKIIDSIENTMEYEYGTINLNDGMASIQVPEKYKFLNAEQSKYVLTDLWGNPPSEVLGMLLPTESKILGDAFTYAVEITYSEEGYIKDKDAKKIDYEELLEEMQKDTEEANKDRVSQGYEAIELVGWASQPFYDASAKKLHWAKELKFEGYDENTLNYNIRVLGRKGVLNLNAIGNMDILDLVKQDIDQVITSVQFNEGYRYADFNPDIDEVAAYGIGGLIAGKVLAKAGFFAILLKFWKFIAIGAVGLFSAFRKKIFGGGKSKEA